MEGTSLPRNEKSRAWYTQLGRPPLRPMMALQATYATGPAPAAPQLTLSRYVVPAAGSRMKALVMSTYAPGQAFVCTTVGSNSTTTVRSPAPCDGLMAAVQHEIRYFPCTGDFISSSAR